MATADGSLKYENLEPHYFLRPQQHMGYINSIDIDKQTRNLLLCGGGDGVISIWDLQSEPDKSYRDEPPLFQNIHTTPVDKLDRKQAHDFGVSKVQWWPFDNAMFFSGSYDGKVKIWDSESLEEVYSFAFDNKVYNLDVNSVQEDGLVAVALNHPIIRLVDLRVGGSAQSLRGHSSGSVYSVKWSPLNDYELASGGSDGTVRIWDVRQANQEIASLDLTRTDQVKPLTPPSFRKAHRAIVNGLAWHPVKHELLSVGLDNKTRVWDLDIEGGLNKSINFGPLFQNRREQTLDPCITQPFNLASETNVNVNDTSDGDEFEDVLVFLPSDTGDLLMCQYADGRMVNRYTPPGKENRIHRQSSVISRGGEFYEILTTPFDGSVLVWKCNEDDDDDNDVEEV